ncbi:MAG: transposase [Candidatus Omnitrophica bacterium]|nr:transposase [Candidatus Omnitrophota bacterium]
MPRQSRIVIPDIPHHVTQRGNYKQTVFGQSCDFKKYISWLNEYSKKYNIDVLAYCLMSNHVHFIVVPREENTLARLFNTLH